MINYSQNLFSLTQAILKDNPSLLSLIRDKRYRIKDTGLTYRQVNSLDDSNLIRNSRKSTKEWRNFSLVDLLFLHYIKQSREFNTVNIQLEYLKKVFYESKRDLKGIGELYYSEIAVIALLTGLVPIGILLFSDGDAVLTDNPEISISMGMFDLKKRAYYFVMLYETFKPTIEKIKEEKDFKAYQNLDKYYNYYSTKPISYVERSILNVIEEKDYKSIKITKKPNGVIDIEYSVSKDAKGITKKELFEAIGGIQFGHSLINYEKGLPNSIVRTEKKRFQSYSNK